MIFYRDFNNKKKIKHFNCIFLTVSILITTYTNLSQWHQYLYYHVGGNQHIRRKPTCQTWWPNDYLICRRWALNPGSSKRQVHYHRIKYTCNKWSITNW